ncbi:MAG: hypothetical protein K2N53_02245, partial [Clostridia bacterium]|nr:hypothetical protein [Clostridia bacterium]
SFTDENSIKVSPRYKEGYTLEGFYTLENGNGTKMIDWNGTCLSSSFSGDGSTVLYPYYKNIDYSYVYEGPVWYDENPKTASYNVYGDPQLIYGKVANLKDIDYILKVANSNPDLHFNLTAKAYLYDDAGKFYVGIGTKVDKSNLLKHISFNRPSSYTEMTVSAEIRGKALTINDTNVIIGVFCTKFGHAVYFKNLQIEISIIEP